MCIPAQIEDPAFRPRRVQLLPDTANWGERLLRSLISQSKYRFRFISLFPMPWASYQCNSATRTRPLASRILATPLTLRQFPRPYIRWSRGKSRIPGPLAIVSISAIVPRTSKFIGNHSCLRARFRQALANAKGPSLKRSLTCLCNHCASARFLRGGNLLTVCLISVTRRAPAANGSQSVAPIP